MVFCLVRDGLSIGRTAVKTGKINAFCGGKKA
jgi:hypothetical protein